MRRMTIRWWWLVMLAALAATALFATYLPVRAQTATATPTKTLTPTTTATPTKTTTPTITATPTATPPVTYVVQQGDQLLKIARKFGTTVAAIKAINHLPNDTIYVGQILIIPPPSPTSTPKPTIPPSQAYVVQPGDQLLKIARKFGITLSALKAANGLTSDVIVPGQVLFIPTPPPPTATPKATATLAPGNVYYTVQTGDRLVRLAAMYGVTVDAIQKANNLSSTVIRIGRTLLIPGPTRHPVGYTVLRGDSLTSIAKLFDTTVDTLKLINRMKNDTIFAGLVLLVPSK